MTVAAIEAGANFAPTSRMDHYVIKVEGSMTTACALTN